LEKARGVDEGGGTSSDSCAEGTDLLGSSESLDGVGEGIDGVGVVEGLGAKGLEEGGTGLKGGTVIDVGIWLDDPDELLSWVVEVELDLVGGGTDGLVTGEL
jgi:hypothetical protein